MLMTDSEKVTNYIAKHERWSEELATLRAIFQQTELKEEVKWGAPNYTLDGKLIAGMAAFKNHYALWFHQGVFLKDSHNYLINAQKDVTKALRQWRFEEATPIPEKKVLEYIEEAIQNSKDGKEHTPVRNKKLVMPPELKSALVEDDALTAAFKKLTPGKQREYADHISSAKQAATKERRLDKIIPMIKSGVGLHDKYKNC
tara:strand:- start:2266 stop:2868 length:603 start_codon:yes stop_codon:yes gene_type:complete